MQGKMKIFRNGLLAATAAGALMVGAATPAHALKLLFAPGGSGGENCVVPGSCGGNAFSLFGAISPALDAQNPVSVFNWTTANNASTASPFSLPQQWGLNIFADGSISESFTFHLQTTQPNTTPGNPQLGAGSPTSVYGSNAGGSEPFPTHVIMTADLTGMLRGGAGAIAEDVETIEWDYTGATFTMIFDEDGDTEGADAATDQKTIALFGSTIGPSSGNDPDTSGVKDLSWTLSVDGVAPNTFFLPDGTDVTDGGTDAGGGLLTLPGFGLDPLDVFQFTTQTVFAGEAGDPDGGGPIVRQLVLGGNLSSAHTTIRAPEPGTFALFGTGLLGLGLAARRRRRKA